jgi:hypothetical protein
MARPRRWVVLASLSIGLGFARGASAEEGEPSSGSQRGQWYGWQTLTTDGAAGALAAGTFATNGGVEVTFWTLGIGTYALGPPIIHLAHGRPAMATGDLALRLGVPALGMLLGAQVDASKPLHCNEMLDCHQSSDGMVAGGLIAAAAVAALDASVFAYDASERRIHKDAARAGFAWWPSLALTPRGGRAGVSGSF